MSSYQSLESPQHSAADPRNHSISYEVVFAFDPEPARKSDPILATVRWYRILQLLVFFCCPTSTRSVDIGIRDILPSATTLFSRSARDQYGNYDPVCHVLLTVLLLAGIRNCNLQLCVFYWCPVTCRPRTLHGICIYIIIGGGRPTKTSGEAVAANRDILWAP
jgi:hypothetical protein